MAIDPQRLADAIKLGTATLHEAAGRIGALPATLRPVSPSMRLAGPAFTVVCPSGDNLWIHRAIYAAQPGDVLVVATGETTAQWGYWGEIMTVAAQSVSVGGLVLQGGTRDHDALTELGFPVYSLGACIRGTIKDKARDHGRLGEPVDLGGTTVERGDLIVGDTDGLVAIPCAAVDNVIDLGPQRVAKERDAIDALRTGASTLDLYDLR
jgi:4-hydroxy-4-methyl-2-oxoglutarate aldolase